jgi:hypothetical protein
VHACDCFAVSGDRLGVRIAAQRGIAGTFWIFDRRFEAATRVPAPKLFDEGFDVVRRRRAEFRCEHLLTALVLPEREIATVAGGIGPHESEVCFFGEIVARKDGSVLLDRRIEVGCG